MPPAAAWDNIAAALDESHLADKFPATLYNAEATPATTWAAIANALDEQASKTFPENIHDIEVSAPAAAWSSIAVALDDSHLADKFPSTLYNAVAIPPAAAWEKIKAALETEEEKAAPVRRMFPALFRYAAAAAIIAAVVFGGIKLLNNNKSTKEELADKPTTPTIEKTTPDTNSEVAVNPPTETTDPSQDARDAAALEDSKKLYASLDADEMQRIKRVSETHFLSAVDPMNTSSTINPGNTYRDLQCSEVSSPSFNDDDSPIDMATRYSMLMTPDGHIVRISKKLGPMVCCVSGEDTDEDCNNQLKKWKERLANSDAGTSSGSFLDILNLIQSFK